MKFQHFHTVLRHDFKVAMHSAKQGDKYSRSSGKVKMRKVHKTNGLTSTRNLEISVELTKPGIEHVKNKVTFY